MCGFAGIWNTNIEYFAENLSNKIFSSLKNRGPDSSQYISFKVSNNSYCHLWHTRLAIQDLDTRSNQPYYDEKCHLVYNGEIYNHSKFKINYPRRIRCDTDFLWNLLRNDIFSKEIFNIEGMWSFAFIDNKLKNIHLSRDRFGQKPLYYAFLKNNKGVAFASSIKALLNLLDFHPNLNYSKLQDYLYLGFRSINLEAQDSFIDDIKCLKPGNCIYIDEDFNISERNNFLNTRNENSKLTYDNLKDNLFDLFTETIDEVLISDKPVSILLSGGIDSSFIFHVLRKLNKENKISAYSYHHGVKGYDETKNINLNLKNYTGRHYYSNSKNLNIEQLWWDLTSENLFPLASQSAFSYASLVKDISINKEVVILSGVGADELFGGYYTHLISYLADIYASNKDDKLITNWLDSPIYKNIRMPILKNLDLFLKHSKENLFGFHEYNEKNNLFKELPNYKNRDFPKRSKSILNDILTLDLTKYTLPPALYFNDLISMHFSCEARAPFLFNKIVDLALSIPKEFLFKNLTTKSILRSSAQKCIPNDIAGDKNKIGFYGDVFEIVNPVKDKVISCFDNSNFLNDKIDRNKLIQLLDGSNLDNVMAKSLFVICQTAIIEDCFNGLI